MRHRDDMRVRGHVTITVYRGGKVDQHYHRGNLVVNSGLQLLGALLVGTSNERAGQIAVGTGTAAPQPTDTALGNEVIRGAFTSTWQSGSQLILSYFLDTTQANGQTLTEAGLFGTNNTLIARVTYPPIVKDENTAVLYQWTLLFGAA